MCFPHINQFISHSSVLMRVHFPARYTAITWGSRRICRSCWRLAILCFARVLSNTLKWVIE